jgi:hypothetical protein
VVDAQDLDAVGVPLNGVQNPVSTASSVEQALELPQKALADATRR